MTGPDELAVDDLSVLLPDWQRHLRAINLAPRTIDSYLEAGSALHTYLIGEELPTAAGIITRGDIEGHLGRMQDRVKAATVAKHYRSLQQLFRWLLDDGEIPVSPMAKMRPPQVPEQPVPVIPEEQLRRLVDSCTGNSFYQRRDNAIIRTFLDCGVRLSELTNLEVDHVDFDLDVIRVIAKGRREHAAPFGNKTADALRRYMRARARHPHASEARLWLGRKGALTGSGIAQMLERRAGDVGIEHLNPHRFRHTMAHRWLAAGGQEQDLMRIANWRSREMVGRYAASAATERARQAHKRMALGDQL